jgi:hypothetical protein
MPAAQAAAEALYGRRERPPERKSLATAEAGRWTATVETEVNALRAEEEQAEALAAYVHHHLKPPRSL